ncbi:peptidoglycan D,D-transpeptidase FtsI family protein [Streptomonospora nanhaiensis]|uniref:Peptidoglycan glycosyltransferase n=1 Tax=Streptomonospora nanhaiensis TaxID=1323731 RepID=A0A853BR57_9ACTN|nr:penicillin-binding protein 2 [Streptomonospora nanhaiensis]MBV2364292.1 penicillin-binding protein 2 [Streptomonospora nanhaiensis]MBX9390399.1 penicillin-binding protein 2 [Streptomonospora nanhaiensis]NYI97176.1 peptidoglycan glycosyltransferase [Streptomonospora nanhaiensis]
MNKPIRRLSIFALALFGVLLLNVSYIQAFAAEDLREHPFNRRQFAESLNTHRGSIRVGSQEVAYSEPVGGDSDQYQRVYENGQLYAPVVGAFRAGSATGIEAAENSFLDGSHESLAVNNFRDMLTGEEPKGADVTLTINADAQQAAMEGLEALGKNGAAVALDPATGAVLASYSNPSYDPNSVASVTETDQAAENWTDLEAAEQQPLLNRGLNQRYPPGSTFKIVTAAAALENGASPDSTIDAPETLDLGAPLPNAWGGPCNNGAPDSLAHSIEISCNTSMANWAIQLGGQAMQEQAEAFGFNQGDMEIPLPVTESLSPLETDPNILGRSGIGQANIEATPLQMAMVAAGVANDGDVMKPYLVESVRNSNLEEVDSAQPEVYSTAISPGTAADLTEMMIGVTAGDEASGPTAQIPGIDVAGKTGTAETASGPTHNWFISFAPADDPQVAVAVVVEHGGGSGGTLAAPIAREIMEAVINE